MLQFGPVGLAALGFAPGGDGEIAHHRVEERLQVAGEGEAGKLPEEIDERLLKDIQRQAVVAGETGGQVRDPIPMAMIQDFERRGVTLVDRGNQFLVGSRILGWFEQRISMLAGW